MQNFFTALTITLAAFAFHSSAFAGNECVPTMSVEAAQAQYDAGMASLSKELSQAYSKAAADCNQANTLSLQRHTERVQQIEAQYEQTVKEIRADYKLGWQQAMTAAAQQRNQGLKEASSTYMAETQAHTANYNQATMAAQNSYNQGAAAVTAQYNTAVCAGQ